MSLSDDELAAALVAVRCYLEHETQAGSAQDEPPTDAWRVAAVIEGHGLTPARNGAGAAWAGADRAGREARWSRGIVGG